MGKTANFKTELLAGVTTFLACAYIIIVNPLILSQTGMPFSGLVTATIMVSAFSTILMGVYAKNPIVVAPGMGLNTFFTYTLVQSHQLSWQTALGVVFWTGVIFVILSLSTVREKIVKAIPLTLRYAISCGIGLFIAVIGLVNSKLIVSNPITVMSAGPLTPEVLTFLFGLFLVCFLMLKNVRGSFLFGMIAVTILAYPLGRFYGNSLLVEYKGIFSLPDFSLLFQLDYWGALKLSLLPALFTGLFTDLFDSISTFVAVAESGNLKEPDGRPKNLKKALLVDAISTLFSGLVGSSAGTSYIESATGIQQGGRTGTTAVVAGLLFLPFLFLSPMLSLIPSIATAPVLVCVGILMMAPVAKIQWNQWDEAFPAFLALILIPLTYSITQGIMWGFLSFTFCKLIAGKRQEISPTLMIINILAAASFLQKVMS
jgi:AGZA family xanthine/uracil permease-like MFS transporter